MKERKVCGKRFVPYNLTPTWFAGICRSTPNSDSFTSELISEKTETHVEHELIGYNDVVEYMMCNDGEYPPPDVPCHGETEPVNVTETTFRMHENVADLIRTFCLESNDFKTFCQFLDSSGINLTNEFTGVKKFRIVSEISAKHIPKNMFVFPSDVKVNKPRFWLSSAHAYHNENYYSCRVILVQPNRKKQDFLIYTFKRCSTPKSNSFFATAFKAKNREKHRLFITETCLVKNAIIISTANNSRFYTITI